MRTELRYAIRSLLRDRGFAATVVLSLALGIGANTAIFSVVNGVLLRPLAYRDPDRIVMVGNTWRDRKVSMGQVSEPAAQAAPAPLLMLCQPTVPVPSTSPICPVARARCAKFVICSSNSARLRNVEKGAAP